MTTAQDDDGTVDLTPSRAAPYRRRPTTAAGRAKRTAAIAFWGAHWKAEAASGRWNGGKK